jgi:hypothetical protein
MIPAYEASRIEKRTWAAPRDLETVSAAYAISVFPIIEPSVSLLMKYKIW